MVLVIVHELGHMVAAKACGMRVERFKIFFGPSIAKFGKGETSYELGVIPLGGYVKITGMTREESLPEDVVPRTYYNAAPWKRIVTIAAGPLVNIVLAFLIFAAYFWIGERVPNRIDFTGRISNIERPSPASDAGLLPGDRFLAVNGVELTGVAEQRIEQVRTQIQANNGRPIDLVVERDGGRLTKVATPREMSVDDPDSWSCATAVRLGFGFERREVGQRVVRKSFLGGIATAWDFTGFFLEQNAKGIVRAFRCSDARDDVTSIVGIAAVSNEIADSSGWEAQLRFAGIISLALGIFNLLPLFPLDGGHILFTLIERVRRRPLSRAAYERAGLIGFVLIGLLAVYAVQNDIGRLTGEGFRLDGR